MKGRRKRMRVYRFVLQASGIAAMTALAALSVHAESITRGKGAGREPSGAEVFHVPLDHIVITALPGTLYSGVTLAHFARGVWKDGREATLPTAIWRSSDPAVATVDRAGNVTARKSGIVTITAEADGVRGVKTYAIMPRPAEKILIDLPGKPIRPGDIA
jgi:hypothetical protein